MSERFLKKQRMKHFHFQSVFSNPDFRVSNQFFLILVRDNQCSVPRLGLVVPKKKVKQAIARNQVKRLCREFFRLHQQQLGARDVVILIRDFPVVDSKIRLRQALETLCEHLFSRF